MTVRKQTSKTNLYGGNTYMLYLFYCLRNKRANIYFALPVYNPVFSAAQSAKACTGSNLYVTLD